MNRPMEIEDSSTLDMEKYVTYFPGYEFVTSFVAAIPVYRVVARIAVVEERPLPILSEFVLRLVDAGVQSTSEIGLWLGLPEQPIAKTTALLLRAELLSYDAQQSLCISTQGKNALETQRLRAPRVAGLTSIVDGIIGELEPLSGGLLKRNAVKRHGAVALIPYKPKPETANIDFSAIRGLVRRMSRDKHSGAPPGELIDVIGVEQSFVEYRKVRILVFVERGGSDFEIMVFDRRYRMPEHETALKRMERAGMRVIPSVHQKPEGPAPLFYYDVDEAKKVSEQLATLRVEHRNLSQRLSVLPSADLSDDEGDLSTEEMNIRSELEDRIDAIQKEMGAIMKGCRHLASHEYGSVLQRAINEANTSVLLLVSQYSEPFLDSGVVDAIKTAVTRGVSLTVGHYLSHDDPSHQSLGQLEEEFHGSPRFVTKALGTPICNAVVSDTSCFAVMERRHVCLRSDTMRFVSSESGFFCGNEELVPGFRDKILAVLAQEGHSGKGAKGS